MSLSDAKIKDLIKGLEEDVPEHNKVRIVMLPLCKEVQLARKVRTALEHVALQGGKINMVMLNAWDIEREML